jgi:16S rRNA (cytidine1402-2'-O)-methyltransferase
MAGTLFVVATPIGNLEDISARALRVLREVSLIAAEDTRRTAHLLARFGITTPTTSLHAHNEVQKTSALIGRLNGGADVALVSDAGTPALSDPGATLVRAAREAGIRVSPIPGPSAVAALISVAGIDGGQFTFLGFPPTRSKDRDVWMEKLSRSHPAAIFYEAPHRVRRTLEEIQARLGDIQVIVGRELTKVHEELVEGPISETLERLTSPVGEFSVLAQIGLSPDYEKLADASVAATTPAAILDEFVQLTKSEGLTRRQAISSLSRKHRLPAREVFAQLEKAKGSVG